uniref:Transferrin n=1 Tax=Cacopsylla melanoneura TaxID=428564 RepID=A0A8D9EZF6_9HEMI
MYLDQGCPTFVYPWAAREQPKQYLVKSNYEDVIGRVGDPIKPIRWCVTSPEGMSKCLAFKNAAFSRDIRPPFVFNRGKSSKGCFCHPSPYSHFHVDMKKDK